MATKKISILGMMLIVTAVGGYAFYGRFQPKAADIAPKTTVANPLSRPSEISLIILEDNKQAKGYVNFNVEGCDAPLGGAAGVFRCRLTKTNNLTVETIQYFSSLSQKPFIITSHPEDGGFELKRGETLTLRARINSTTGKVVSERWVSGQWVALPNNVL